MVNIEIRAGHSFLNIESDGLAHFKIEGDCLRHMNNEKVTEYETDDDMHVIGLINWLLGAFFSQEVLKRALAEHDKKLDKSA